MTDTDDAPRMTREERAALDARRAEQVRATCRKLIETCRVLSMHPQNVAARARDAERREEWKRRLDEQKAAGKARKTEAAQQRKRRTWREKAEAERLERSGMR